MNNFVIGVVLLFITGWSAAAATTDAPPFELDPVSDYSANIYVYSAYNNPLLKGTYIAQLELDGRKVADLRLHTYLLLKVAPGKRTINANNQAKKLSQTIQAEAGKNYFLKYSLGLDVDTTLIAGVGIYHYHLGTVTEQYALSELPALKPTGGLAIFVKRQQCERLIKHGAQTPLYCRPVLHKKPDKIGKGEQYIADLAGTYEVDITSSSPRHFKTRKQRHFNLEITQQGDNVVGMNKVLNLKVIGKISDSEIEFYTLPSRITSREIVGTWAIEPIGGLLEGKWELTGGELASGEWNLTRAKLPPAGATNSVAVINMNPATNLDIAGKYVSEITTSKSRQLGNKYKDMVIELSRSGKSWVASEEKFGSTIYLSRDKNVIEFEVRPGKATGRKTVRGVWKINPNNGNLAGSWKSNTGDGQWNLNRID